MTERRKEHHNTNASELEESYNTMVARSEEQHPGINDLLKLYGQFQEGLRQSQEYLGMFQRVHPTSTSNSSVTDSR